jgi:hypothetical protein
LLGNLTNVPEVPYHQNGRRRWDGKLVILVSQFDIRSTCEHPSPIQFMPYINTINPGSVEITVNRARAALDMRLSTLSNRPRYLRHYAWLRKWFRHFVEVLAFVRDWISYNNLY